MKIRDTTVFITGGAGGIGTAFAQALLEKGANVVIADIEETRGAELEERFSEEFGVGRVSFISCDVTDSVKFKDAFETAISSFRRVDVMVNNAGIFNERDMNKLLDVNLKGVITGTEIALAHMRKDRGGHGGIIVNVASVIGYDPVYYRPLYTASKHGVIGYTRSLASIPDLIEQGVRYACMCPELVNTPIFQENKPVAYREGYYEDAVTIISQERINPEIVARGLLSLIADDDSNNALLEVSLKNGLVRRKIMVHNA